MRGPTHGARWHVCPTCGTLNERRSWGDFDCRRCGQPVEPVTARSVSPPEGDGELRSASDLAADVRGGLCPNWPHPGVTGCTYCIHTEDAANALRELVARLEAAEAQVAALTQERDDFERRLKLEYQVRLDTRKMLEAAEAALTEAREILDGSHARGYREGVREEKARTNQALADTRQALAAYRSALRSGEPETDMLREQGDRALAATGGTSLYPGTGQEQQP